MDRTKKAWINGLFLIVTLVINTLGAVGLINGLTQKQISDMYVTLITPSPATFSILGNAYIGGELVKEKTAVKLTAGDHVEIKAIDQKAQVLFISSLYLHEPIFWGGPIVMNTKDELEQAFDDLKQGTFMQIY